MCREQGRKPGPAPNETFAIFDLQRAGTVVSRDLGEAWSETVFR